MRLTTSSALMLLGAVLFGTSCTELAAVDPAGNTGVKPGSTLFAPGTVGAECKLQQDGCQYLSNECSADAECARWYQCALSCNVSSNVQSCVSACDDGTTLVVDRTKLTNCLINEQGCLPTQVAPSLEGGETKGVGGSGGVAGADYADGGNGLGGQAPAPPPDEHYANCGECMRTECAYPCFEATQNDDCWDFKHFYSTCTNEPLTTEHAFETCLSTHESDDAAWAPGHPGWIKLGMVNCLLEKCPSKCTPPDYQQCVKCQKTECSDQFNAYNSSAVAQDFQWCSTKCKYLTNSSTNDSTSCADDCLKNYGAGKPIVGALMGCSIEFCPACNDLP